MWVRLNRAYLQGQSILVRVEIDFYKRDIKLVDEQRVFLTGGEIRGMGPVECPTCMQQALHNGDRQVRGIVPVPAPNRWGYTETTCDDEWHEHL
jgi:hypothetical protein